MIFHTLYCISGLLTRFLITARQTLRFAWNKLKFLQELLRNLQKQLTAKSRLLSLRSSPCQITVAVLDKSLISERLFLKHFFKIKSNLRCCWTLPSRKRPFQIVKYFRKIFFRMFLAQHHYVTPEQLNDCLVTEKIS